MQKIMQESKSTWEGAERTWIETESIWVGTERNSRIVDDSN